jgi:hypothetical protein
LKMAFLSIKKSSCKTSAPNGCPWFALFLLLFSSKAAFPVDSSCSGVSTTDYAYRQSTGAKVDTIYRSFISSANGIIITYRDAGGMKSKTFCDDKFNIRSWHYENKETGYNITATRTGDTIAIKGIKGEKTIQKLLTIDSLSWYQPLEFSLLSFLKSGRPECGFWMIRPTDMSAFKMVARRKTITTVRVDGRIEKALKVTLSPRGIGGKLWHATYWYRANDYSFLKNEFPRLPGASPTITESIQKK